MFNDKNFKFMNSSLHTIHNKSSDYELVLKMDIRSRGIGQLCNIYIYIYIHIDIICCFFFFLYYTFYILKIRNKKSPIVEQKKKR